MAGASQQRLFPSDVEGVIDEAIVGWHHANASMRRD
jgi:hypothetical protein